MDGRVRGAWPAVLAAVMLAATACSSEDDATSSVVTTVPVATTGTPPVSVPAAAVVPTEALDDRLEATLEMPSPSWLAADDEAVYVRRDDGIVARIDPATNEFTTLAEIPGGLCQGIGVGFGAVWTCAGSDVVSVDLETGALGDPVAVGKAATQGHLGVGHDRVWVLVGDGSELVGIDPPRAHRTRPSPSGSAAPTWPWTSTACGWPAPWTTPWCGSIPTTVPWT